MTKEDSVGRNISRREALFQFARAAAVAALTGRVITVASESPEQRKDDSRSLLEKLLEAQKTRKIEAQMVGSDAIIRETDELKFDFVPGEAAEVITSFSTPEGKNRTSSRANRHVVDSQEARALIADIQNFAKPLTDQLYPALNKNRSNQHRLLSVQLYVQDPSSDDNVVPLREIPVDDTVVIILKGGYPVARNAIKLVGLHAGLRYYYGEKFLYEGEATAGNAKEYIELLFKDSENIKRAGLEASSTELIKLFQLGSYIPNFDKLTDFIYRQLAYKDPIQLVASAAAVMRVCPNSLIESLSQLTSGCDQELVKGFMREIIEHTPNEFFDDSVKRFSRS